MSPPAPALDVVPAGAAAIGRELVVDVSSLAAEYADCTVGTVEDLEVGGRCAHQRLRTQVEDYSVLWPGLKFVRGGTTAA